MTRGAANTGAGEHRGEHLWLDAILADGTPLLVDPTGSSNGEAPGALHKSDEEDTQRIEDPGSTVYDDRRHFTVVPEPKRFAQRSVTHLLA